MKYTYTMQYSSSSLINSISTNLNDRQKNFIKQKNDYALSKWVSEIQIMNSKEKWK